MIKKPRLPELDEQSATAILENVFLACEREPCSIPLEVLSSYTQYRRDRFTLQKRILLFTLIVFLLLPLCFIAPRFTVEQVSLDPGGVPTYELCVTTLIPVRQITAHNGRSNLPVYEDDYSVYTFSPLRNGWLQVNVTLLNRQYDVWSVYVDSIDEQAPSVLSTEYIDGKLRVYVEDSTGVDYARIRATLGDESPAGEISYNAEEGYFELPAAETLVIFIPDLRGNTLQLDVKIKFNR